MYICLICKTVTEDVPTEKCCTYANPKSEDQLRKMAQNAWVMNLKCLGRQVKQALEVLDDD